LRYSDNPVVELEHAAIMEYNDAEMENENEDMDLYDPELFDKPIFGGFENPTPGGSNHQPPGTQNPSVGVGRRAPRRAYKKVANNPDEKRERVKQGRRDRDKRRKEKLSSAEA
jgi:hypothetical protein